MAFRLTRHQRWHRWMYTLPSHGNTQYHSALCITITLAYIMYFAWLLINNSRKYRSVFHGKKNNISNKFILHNYNIFPSVPTCHDIDWLIPVDSTTDHVTHSVQLAQSVKSTDPALYNAASIPVGCKFIWHFWTVELLLLSALNIRVPSRFYSSIYFPRRRKIFLFS